jgi:predicted branched-subunit amino acid permease
MSTDRPADERLARPLPADLPASDGRPVAQRKVGGRCPRQPLRMAVHEILRAPAPARASALAGAVAAVPLVVGLAPFALSVGAAVGASADPVAAWVGTLLIYSGSAQLGLLQLLQDGTPVWAAVLAAALINSRLIVYSAALAPLWAGARLRWRVLGAATIVEPTYALAEQRRSTGAGREGALTHYAGAAAAITVAWLAVVSLGALIGRTWTAADHLAVAVPLCLVVLVVPHLRLPGGVAAVVAGAVTAVGARFVLPGTEILLAMAAAALAGSLGPRRES